MPFDCPVFVLFCPCLISLLDIGRDCDETRLKYGLDEDRVVYIDLDGHEGSLAPFLVQCDVTSYPHTAVTSKL